MGQHVNKMNETNQSNSLKFLGSKDKEKIVQVITEETKTENWFGNTS